jgi:hypothetical protein
LWTTSEESESNALPERLYPAFAPLPIPLAEHLILLESRQNRSQKGDPPWLVVLRHVLHERRNVYEYMDDFVQEDAQKPRRMGRGLSFPDATWLLDELRSNTPTHHGPARRTFYDWQERGLLLRERERGPFDLDSVAALLIVRIVEDEHEQGWLPERIEDDTPRWWCYGRETPASPILSIPVPLSDTLPPMLLWTPWCGAAWQKEWHIQEGIACRWSPAIPTKEDLYRYGTSEK